MTSELAHFLAQWLLFGSVVAAMAGLLVRARSKLEELERQHRRRRRHLWHACLHLRAARKRGQRLDPFVDRLVDDALAWCPDRRSGVHEFEGDRGCTFCGIHLRE